MQRKGGFLLSYIFLKKYLLYGEALRVHSIFPAKRLIQSEKLNSVPARWPEPNAGVARHVGGSHAYAEAPADRHIWLLIFWFFCTRLRKALRRRHGQDKRT
jgi:hypothetical protein